MSRTQPSLDKWLVSIVCVACLASPALAQIPGMDKVKGAIGKGTQDSKEKDKDKPAQVKGAEPGQAAAATIVFSAAPIDPAKPANLAASFESGGHIYGLIQVDKTWRELLGKGREDVKEIQVPIDMLVDGENADFQYITIKKPEALDTKYLVLDIAPDPEKMTAYKDPGFFYAEGKGNRKIGPDQYTYILGKLAGGQHTIRFQIRSYGDIFSAGEFKLTGGDYKFYTELREKVLAAALQVGTMPKAQMVNKELEATMRKLLENAGWKDIRKLVITDKDWWLDRAEGGDSPIVSRHIAAAAATKADDGSFFWCICTFHQQKHLDGSFGPLELTDQGQKKPIKEENIDK